MFCVADKSPCHAEVLFSANLLLCSGLKPAHFKGELLFILICDSMQSMLFVKSLICALQSKEQNICDSLQMYSHFRPSFSRIPLHNGESKVVNNLNKETYFHVSLL